MEGQDAAPSAPQMFSNQLSEMQDIFNAEDGGDEGIESQQLWSTADDAAPAPASNANEEEEGEVDSEPGSDGAAGATGEFSDEHLSRIDSKKEAKKLGTAAYKRWKSLQKKSKKKHSSDSEHKKDKKKKKGKDGKRDKKDKSKKDKKKKKKSSKKPGKHDGGGGDSADDVDDDDLEAQYAALATEGVEQERAIRAAAGGRKGLRSRATTGGGGAGALAASGKNQSAFTPLKAQEVRSLAASVSAAVLQRMREARARGPLALIAISREVLRQCQRSFLHEELVAAGVLDELSHWLYDFTLGQPAALELRTTALDALALFRMEGEPSAAGGDGRRGDDDEHETKRTISTYAYEGISKADLLKASNLGRAVEALRTHADELHDNRTKCVALLTRFSRVFAERHGGGGGGGRAVRAAWRCMGDKDVANPYETVQTGAEAFSRAFMKADPKDPTSYDNFLPWKPPTQVVTNLMGHDGRTGPSR